MTTSQATFYNERTIIKIHMLLVLCAAFLLRSTSGIADTGEDPTVARGRYLVTISGCNDCHTLGYLASNGTTPEGLWLTGDSFGWSRLIRSPGYDKALVVEP